MFLNIIIVTIFLLLVLICILPFEVTVILFKLLLLNMQIIISWFHSFFSKNNEIIVFFLEYCGVKKASFDNTANTTSFIIDSNLIIKENQIINCENLLSNDTFDEFNFIVGYNKIIDLFFSFDYWFFLPICLYLFIIYFLHALLGLYSAYVDYFQKNPDHLDSMRAFLPAVFIFYFIIFIISVIILYFFLLYLSHIIWFLFI
jgi:hypothetical protein